MDGLVEGTGVLATVAPCIDSSVDGTSGTMVAGPVVGLVVVGPSVIMVTVGFGGFVGFVGIVLFVEAKRMKKYTFS